MSRRNISMMHWYPSTFFIRMTRPPYSLGFRYALSVWYPTDPAKLETPSTYMNFDLLCRNEAKMKSQFPRSKVYHFFALDYGMENLRCAFRITGLAGTMELTHAGSTVDL
ncbi:hypothetical protein V8E53_013018 [Lactarius tabidus]